MGVNRPNALRFGTLEWTLDAANWESTFNLCLRVVFLGKTNISFHNYRNPGVCIARCVLRRRRGEGMGEVVQVPYRTKINHQH